MLGKRCRTIQRTASISQNMGPNYLHHNYHNYHNCPDFAANAKQNAEKLSLPSHAVNPQVPAIIPQIIGFNPMIKSTGTGTGVSCDQSQQAAPNQSPKCTSTRPYPHDMYDDDPACLNNQLHQKIGSGASACVPTTSKRSQITPRSALQTLLAAARQITFPSSTDQSINLINGFTAKNEGSMAQSSLKTGASPTTISISAKQGLWQGFSALSEVKSKDINNKHNSAVISEATKPAPESYYRNENMNEAEYCDVVFDAEEISYSATDSDIGSESMQSQHALYLATSPLSVDFMPNLTASMSFLESCYLCRRLLGQGRDIFMYRGESAFCSMECRDKQMRMEEMKEKLRPPAQMQPNMNMNDVQKQDNYTNSNITSSSNVPHHQHHHHKQHHHHHQYSGQSYNNKQHRTSLLMPVA